LRCIGEGWIVDMLDAEGGVTRRTQSEGWDN